MTEKLIVEDHPELIKDTYSKGIVSRDVSAYEKYMESALKRKERQSRLDEVEVEINSIKEQMVEMKDVLHQILNKVNGN
jgi:uncharacterized protein YdcH (DUF465 family)|tara:strand:- start:1246 stop:1482 length:237 start_codon:yes stop_codon:yes gene_type:complete